MYCIRTDTNVKAITNLLDNNSGNLATNGLANIRAASISNQGGAISAQQQAVLNSLSYLDNSQSGYIGADNLNLAASGHLNNTGGKIETGNGLTTTDQVIQSAVTSEAQIRASGNINLNVSGVLNNYVSTIAAGGNLSIVGGGSAAPQPGSPRQRRPRPSLHPHRRRQLGQRRPAQL